MLNLYEEICIDERHVLTDSIILLSHTRLLLTHIRGVAITLLTHLRGIAITLLTHIRGGAKLCS